MNTVRTNCTKCNGAGDLACSNCGGTGIVDTGIPVVEILRPPKEALIEWCKSQRTKVSEDYAEFERKYGYDRGSFFVSEGRKAAFSEVIRELEKCGVREPGK